MLGVSDLERSLALVRFFSLVFSFVVGFVTSFLNEVAVRIVLFSLEKRSCFRFNFVDFSSVFGIANLFCIWIKLVVISFVFYLSLGKLLSGALVWYPIPLHLNLVWQWSLL